MNDQITDEPSLTRRLTDGALVLIAIGAVVAWLWRRVSSSANVAPPITPVSPDPVGAGAGQPANGAQVS